MLIIALSYSMRTAVKNPDVIHLDEGRMNQRSCQILRRFIVSLHY